MVTAIEGLGLDIARLSGSLGAEVRGLSLANASSEDAKTIEVTPHGSSGALLPDQHLSPDQHITFGRLFGELESHPNLSLDAERPEFFELRAFGGAGGIADEWHSDLTCQDSPSVMAILHMITSPEVGGDTLWSNQYKAYEELTPAMKEFCEGLTALHDASRTARPSAKRSIPSSVFIPSPAGNRSSSTNTSPEEFAN